MLRLSRGPVNGPLLLALLSLALAYVQAETKSDTTSEHLPLVQDGENPEAAGGRFQALSLSFLMIMASEIGDKTFIIAAIYAMRHPRMLVFSAAASALAVMSVLSAVLGHIVPELLPRWAVSYLAALLFLVFGARMFQEGLNMTKDDEAEEFNEVEAELNAVEGDQLLRGMEGGDVGADDDALKAKGVEDYAERQRAKGVFETATRDGPLAALLSGGPLRAAHAMTTQLHALLRRILSPIFLQTFVLVFLAEWGDRSQIATIALAAAQDMTFVIIGTILGHSICTGGAVIGGRMLAERISVRTVMKAGGILFVLFGFIYLYEAIYGGEASV